jgi:putative ABC transport system permease protein
LFAQALVVLRFAGKMLAHDGPKSLAGIGGVGCAVCLVLIQIGLYFGSRNSMSMVIDRSTADLWVVAPGVTNFDDAQFLPESVLYQVRSVPGVDRAEPFVVAYANWQLPTGGRQTIQMLGFDLEGELLRPWNLMAGQTEDLRYDRSVFVDAGDRGKLHISALRDEAEIFTLRRQCMRAQVRGLTSQVKAFHTNPVIMGSSTNVLAYRQASEGQFTYVLVRTTPGWDRQQVAQAIQQAVSLTEVHTREDFSRMTRLHWTQKTGIGIALLATAFIGAIIGFGTVAVLIYVATMDYLREYATLKAVGAPNRRVVALVVVQAVVTGLCGYLLGLGFTYLARLELERRTLMLHIPMDLLGYVLVGSLALCAAASVFAAIKIIHAEPGIVFNN